MPRVALTRLEETIAVVIGDDAGRFGPVEYPGSFPLHQHDVSMTSSTINLLLWIPEDSKKDTNRRKNMNLLEVNKFEEMKVWALE